MADADHSVMDRLVARFGAVDGVLCVGGVPLTRLVERVGSTPFYAYDRALISTRVGELRRRLPETVRLHYAVKANPMPAVVQHFSVLVDGFDVASVGEMKTALDTMVAPEAVSFAGPGKTATEIAQAVAAGVVLSVESERELACVVEVARQHGWRVPIMLRVNPGFELKSAGMRMGGRPVQFGIDAERVPGLLAGLDERRVDFLGFHVFAGSQNLSALALAEAQLRTVELAGTLARRAPGPVRLLNIGGGLGIPYFWGDAPLDLDEVGSGLSRAAACAAEILPGARLVLELGRFLVGEAGIYVTRILERKESRGEVFLVTDGGLHHHLAASGNFGQVLRRNFPVAIGTRIDCPPDEEAMVVGCLCTPIDVLARQARLPRAEPGDLLVIFQSGAYGATASPTAFLSHPPPVEVVV
jgi:diaminopimelate decarboxylase